MGANTSNTGERIIAEPSGSGAGSRRSLFKERAWLDRTSTSNADVVEARATRSGLGQRALRLVRDAAIGLLLVTSVPFAVVSVHGNAMLFQRTGMVERLANLDRFRTLEAPTDEAVTPLEAGAAFGRLTLSRPRTEFPLRQAAQSRSYEGFKQHMTASVFSSLRDPRYEGPSGQLLAAYLSDELSEDELRYLRTVAESPAWADFDAVATAPKVDIIGGQYVLPFNDEAFALQLPMPRFTIARNLANDAIARAAFYMRNGEQDRAESALRNVVSFGFALVDNGTSLVDAILGQAIVIMGRDAVGSFYQHVGYSKSAAEFSTGSPLSRPPRVAAKWIARARTASEAAQVRKTLVEEAGHPQTPRAVRFEDLRQLAWSTCSSPKQMLLGPDRETRDAFVRARTTLARYPSEQAYLDLLYSAPDRMPEDMSSGRFSHRLALGAASVAGTVLRNLRVTSCTQMALALR